jgi:hypothetical protein
MDVNTRKDEVDMLETAVKLIRFLLKNLMWVLLFPALGLLGAYFLTLKQPVLYESQLILRTSLVTEEELTLLLQNYSRVGIPGIARNEYDKLKDFDIRAYIKDNSLFAVVTTVATDTSTLRKIHEAIPKQLDEEDIIEAYMDANRSYTSEVLREYKAKILMAEGVLHRNKENVLNDGPELLNLYAKAAELELRLKQKSLIKVITQFRPIKLSSTRTLALLKGLAGGLLLAGVFLAIKSFIIYYRKSVKETL